jgi:alpha-ketoglutarate-dependent taurine dioxygenase
MLVHSEDLGTGVGRFTVLDFWHKTARDVIGIVDEFHDHPIAKGFYPHFNEVTFRQTIVSVSPELEALQQQIKWLLDTTYSAIFLDALHLHSFSESDRSKLLYALSLAIGYPTPTDPRKGKLLWDVKPRNLPTDYFATYSEHSNYADLHSDTQYYSNPEKYMLLYTVRAARCGGGTSILCDGRAVRDCLLETKQGRDAYEVLSTFKFPFRIPTTFINAIGATGAKTCFAPIFADEPLIRFRYDTLEKGFELNPELDVPEARHAIGVLVDVLENKVPISEYFMPDDTVMICNNHTALHGRTSFRDRERHLIRVRISHQPLVVRPTVLATA